MNISFQNDWKFNKRFDKGIYFFGLMWSKPWIFSVHDEIVTDWTNELHFWFFNFCMHIYWGKRKKTFPTKTMVEPALSPQADTG